MPTIPVRVPLTLKKRLAAVANQSNLSASAIVIAAVKEFFDLKLDYLKTEGTLAVIQVSYKKTDAAIVDELNNVPIPAAVVVRSALQHYLDSHHPEVPGE